MDPDACMKALADAVGTANWEEAKERAQDMLTWLARGGFPPNVTGTKIFDSLMIKAACEQITRW